MDESKTSPEVKKGDEAMIKYAETVIIARNLTETFANLADEAAALKKKVLNGAAIVQEVLTTAVEKK